MWYVEILLRPITNHKLSTFCSSGYFPREFAAETPPGISYDLGDKFFIPGEMSKSLQVSFFMSVLRLPAV